MFQPFKNSNEVVKQIHDEIDSAQDRLLNEAVKIINSTSEYEEHKSRRLTKCGFINSEIVLKRKPIIESREQAELIEYYKQNYPFQKFITESEMDKICKKYSLIYAPVSAYKKDVPEKNLQDIESATSLKTEDAATDKVWCEIDYSGTLSLGKFKAISLGLPLKIEGTHFRGWIDLDEYLRSNFSQISGQDCVTSGCKNFSANKQGLFIAAPKSHFDLEGLKRKGLFGFMDITITEVKDPVVFRYCRGGIQIITKWGLEASDEMIINQKEN